MNPLKRIIVRRRLARSMRPDPGYRARRLAQARFLCRRERNLRWIDDQPPPEPPQPLTQADVDAMNETMIRPGLGCAALIQDDDGTVRPAPTP